MDFNVLFQKLKSQAAIISVILICVGAYLLTLDSTFRSMPGLLGSALITLGALFIAFAFLQSLLYEERQQTSKLYKGVIALWRGSAQELRASKTEGGLSEMIGGKKKTYQRMDSESETEAE